MIHQRIENITENILKELAISTCENIDIHRIACHLGVDIKSEDMDEDISGFFVMKNDNAYIRYNTNDVDTRKRFTIAHELGHFVLHKDSKPLFVDKSATKIMYRNFDSSTGEIVKEREANAFAASLLMPKHFILREINNMPEDDDPIHYLSIKFKVSDQAMSYRLANLGFISLY